MTARFWVITYDIANGRRLRRVARVMERWGIRAQKSVFECWLSDEDLAALRGKLEAIPLAPQDSVRFYLLCADCRRTASETGETDIRENSNFYLV